MELADILALAIAAFALFATYKRGVMLLALAAIFALGGVGIVALGLTLNGWGASLPATKAWIDIICVTFAVYAFAFYSVAAWFTEKADNLTAENDALKTENNTLTKTNTDLQSKLTTAEAAKTTAEESARTAEVHERAALTARDDQINETLFVRGLAEQAGRELGWVLLPPEDPKNRRGWYWKTGAKPKPSAGAE